MNEEVINNKYCHKIWDDIGKELSSKKFEEDWKKVQKIDSKHYKEKLLIEEMKIFIQKYKSKVKRKLELNKILILQRGNPEIIFQICLELMESPIKEIIIAIQDFCFGQNMLLVETINTILEQNKIKKKIILKNNLKDREIIEEAQKSDRVICIGDSNLYNRLNEKLQDLELNPYGIFEVYTDSEMFEELEETFFKYCYQKEFEAENYSDLDFEDAIRLINKNGYKFAVVLFLKDKEKQNEFRNNIEAKYVIINKNPFKEIEFNL